MTAIRKQHGFSLTEMLIATGIMAIGLVMIATIFPVGVKLTGLSVHRSIAAVVADEAFAKVRLYGLRDFEAAGLNNWPVADPNTMCSDYQYTMLYATAPGTDGLYGTPDDTYVTSGWYEFLYPSTVVPPEERQRYHWSALCRRTGQKDVQVTVFVTHSTFGGMNYYELLFNGVAYAPDNLAVWPMPVAFNVRYNKDGLVSPPRRELVIDPSDPLNTDWDNFLPSTKDVSSFVDEGYTIVNNRDGKIYRVLEMQDNLPSGGDGKRETIVLYEDWQWDGYDVNPFVPPTSAQTETVWVVPPGIGGSSYPCMGVFQRVIHFEEMN